MTKRGLSLAIVTAALVLLALAAPQAAHAAPAALLGEPAVQQEPVAQQQAAATPEIPMTLEEKQGCGCHSPEKESWQMSPHGQIDGGRERR